MAANEEAESSNNYYLKDPFGQSIESHLFKIKIHLNFWKTFDALNLTILPDKVLKDNLLVKMFSYILDSVKSYLFLPLSPQESVERRTPSPTGSLRQWDKVHPKYDSM